MKRILRVLIVDDSEDDAVLIIRQLRQEAEEVISQRVESEQEMRRALDESEWDVIICDHKMPQFDAFAALRLLRDSGKDLPFIVVSGTIGEGTAVATMKAGAHDYIMKGNLLRLGSAIEREIQEADGRRDRRKATAALKESEEKFKAVFDSAEDGIFLEDLEKRTFVAANDAFCRMFGYPSDEITDLGFEDLLFDKDKSDVAERIEAIVRGERTVDAVLPLLTKLRITLYADISWSVLSLAGRPHLLGVLRDVTERKETQEKMALLAKFPDEDPNPVFRISENGKIVYANRASAALLDSWNCSKTKCIARPWYQYVENALQSGKSQRAEVEYSGRVQMLTFAPIVDMGYVNVYGLDITEQKRVSRELEAANITLSGTLEELKQTQSRMIQHERLNALGQMVSGIVHDFNNVLVPILGFSDYLLMEDGPTTTAEIQETLQEIRKAAEDAKNIVKRLREFYRPDENIERTRVKLMSLFEHVITLTEPIWRTQAEAEGRTIRVENSIQGVQSLLANKSQLREVLTNLLINAVDAMPNGGTITLAATAEGDDTIISVSDTGEGMPADIQARCFEPFFSTKGEYGSGLGLAMCHGIIERHGGSIDIESEAGKGTNIRLCFPKIEPVDQHDKSASAVKPLRKLRILAIDDEAWVRKLITRCLSLDHHTLETVETGEEGLQKLAAQSFDLLLTDRAMPDMGGDEIAKKAKELRADLKVVMLTGFGDIMALQDDKPEGVDLVLSKPMTRSDLQLAISSAMAG